MRRSQLILVLSLLAVAPILSACENFDMDKLDVLGLSEKKKLPGDRRAVFPEGVPGVAQGVPPELVKGYQAPPDVVQTEAAEPDQKPQPKPKRRTARVRPASASPPAQATVQPAVPAQPAQQGATAPWPSAPQSGTFQR